MKPAGKQTYTPLLDALRIWGWPFMLRSWGENAAFICEPLVLKAIETITGTLKCRTAGPLRALNIEYPTALHTFLVFTKSGERKLVRQLKEKYPEKRVYSACYDLAPASMKWPSQLPNLTAHTPVNLKADVILLSTPGSDAEYLAQLMAANGLPFPQEYASKPLGMIARHVDHLQCLRYYHNLCRFQGEGQPLNLHLQSDVLMALTNRGVLSMRQIAAFIKKSGAQVIRVTRRDKIAQASLATLVEGKYIRSVRTLQSAQNANFSTKIQIGLSDAINQMDQTFTAEEWLDTLITELPDIHHIELENLVQNPAEHLNQLADFLGIPRPESFTPASFEDSYPPALMRQLTNLNSDLIDRMGLHVSAREALS